ncbi:hypothetical protein JTB14_018370 [Gonioctena quinquepunctata]|nr:hypothetical protein JTB14_018370 [Gonioctena quinquepunctata]
MNGLTNGVVDVLSAQKSSRRGKKNKAFTDGDSEAAIQLVETAHQDEEKVDQSIKSKRNISNVDCTVNSIDSKKNGTKEANTEVDKLDTNDNIFCDNNPIRELQKPDSISEKQSINNVGNDQEASSSTSSHHNQDSQLKEATSDVLNHCVLELADSLKNIQLQESELKSSDALQVKPKIDFIQYESEMQMPMIMKIIQKDLSEPYSIYTYRYFIHNWPKLCFLAMCKDECVGAIICKLDLHRKVIKRGYIAMLAVDQKYRKLRIGSNLVQMAINEMLRGDADEVVLETEVTNKPALQLYEKLGFVRDKRLFRYYLNGVDALRLKLWLR